MEGLTIIQAVLGGLQVIGKILETAGNLHGAPNSIKGLLTEISVMKRILEQLKPIILNDDYQDVEGAQWIELGELVLVFTDLAKTLSNFDHFITQISKRTGILGTALAKNSIWAINEKKFQRDLKKLQYHKSSLTIILTLMSRFVRCVFRHATTNTTARRENQQAQQDYRADVSRLRNELKQHTKCIIEASPRTHKELQNEIYDSTAASTVDADSNNLSIRRNSQRRDVHTLRHEDSFHFLADLATSSINRPRASPATSSSVNNKLRNDLDSFLLRQRPYITAARREQRESFDSTGEESKKLSWSWISMFSLFELSSLSLFELPISRAMLLHSELWNFKANEKMQTPGHSE